MVLVFVLIWVKIYIYIYPISLIFSDLFLAQNNLHQWSQYLAHEDPDRLLLDFADPFVGFDSLVFVGWTWSIRRQMFRNNFPFSELFDFVSHATSPKRAVSGSRIWRGSSGRSREGTERWQRSRRKLKQRVERSLHLCDITTSLPNR